MFNPCAAKLSVSICNSLEAGIANTNFSFKLRKNNIVCEKVDISQIELLDLTEHLPQDMLLILVVFYLVWNLLEKRLYTVLAAQRLNNMFFYALLGPAFS